MSDQIRIESLIPQPLPDLRRVSLVLRVSGLPSYGHGSGSNLAFFPDMPQTAAGIHAEESTPPLPTPNVELFPEVSFSNEVSLEVDPTLGENRSSSLYPDVTLCILDQDGNEIATTFIVEHKESELDFTLHLRTFEPGATYVARAEMTRNNEIIQTVHVPIELT